MSTAYAKNAFRNQGEVKKVELDANPLCSACNKPMGITKRKRIIQIGLDSTYIASIPTYSCQHKYCSDYLKTRIIAENPYSAHRMAYDYEVQTKVVYIRWHEHATYKEVIQRLDERYGIKIDRTAVETILKTYEIACTKTYSAETIAKIKHNGGILVCIDVVEPLKGRKGILVAYDYYTGITLGSKRLPNGKQETYEKFLTNLQNRIDSEFGVPILGIISDALPTQRKAIAAALPCVPHCLCHYHFYALVLKDAKQVDSGIVKDIRSKLRSNYYLKQYSLKKVRDTISNSQFEALILFFEPLEELSNWKRKPKDPCFTGLEMCDRIIILADKMSLLLNKIQTGSISLFKNSIKVLKKVYSFLNDSIHEIRSQLDQLIEIHRILDNLVSILAQIDGNASQGLKRLLNYVDDLHLHSNDYNDKEILKNFIKQLGKYANTKGKLLFNYRTIPNAPTTNNFQELKFKQLKHFLRRVIGHKAAKAYFVSHGEQITYVNADESPENILEILKNCNQAEFRQIIRANRRSMDAWSLVIHDRVKWEKKMEEIDLYIQNLETNLIARS